MTQGHKQRAQPQQYTMLISQIPSAYQSDEALADYFESLYPDSFFWFVYYIDYDFVIVIVMVIVLMLLFIS